MKKDSVRQRGQSLTCDAFATAPPSSLHERIHSKQNTHEQLLSIPLEAPSNGDKHIPHSATCAACTSDAMRARSAASSSSDDCTSFTSEFTT
eukprot:CAMPEP_0185032142 /NCGR_PEP_ID=MMETSP1103-20130426/20036_1 /TAXON_ID=36769 /ORGANISM="Paraphysomonas bandaiensis, Strain Caron Lab Isolate" /LENGTH=91 /DNA_ID=CAMNT_0027567929 /DNA_START=193 /DNA_END=468 /DNA_ORIENTATION=+